MTDTIDEHHARTFSKDEMDEMWATILHQAVFGEGNTENFEYQSWMGPLANIYNKHFYNQGEYAHDGVEDASDLLRECHEAYKSGLMGDMVPLERLIGGYELSQLDVEHVHVKVIKGIIVEDVSFVSLSVLDDARWGGNMEATTPTKDNNGLNDSPTSNHRSSTSDSRSSDASR